MGLDVQETDVTVDDFLTADEVFCAGTAVVICPIGRITTDDDSVELAKDIAMHVAASKPEYISNTDIPEEVIKEESRILRVQVEQEGKPEEIIDKIVDGKLRKQFDQLTLMGQEYVKDPDITVEKLLRDQDASVKSFIRYEVGEGIELDQVNFADEVKAQVDALK